MSLKKVLENYCNWHTELKQLKKYLKEKEGRCLTLAVEIKVLWRQENVTKKWIVISSMGFIKKSSEQQVNWTRN